MHAHTILKKSSYRTTHEKIGRESLAPEFLALIKRL